MITIKNTYTMKKTQLLSILSLALIIAFSFSSCSKDDPVPEIDQEEYDAAELEFVSLETINGELVETDESVVITFSPDGKSAPSHSHLTEGETYRLKVTLFHDGESINQEILDAGDEHQFFFVGAPDGVFDYRYEDQNVGLTGVLTVTGHSDAAFDWNIVLRHGLNKNHAAAQEWDSTDYVQAGGADDVNVTAELHVTATGEHDH